jgi:hypothetical protein
MLTIFISSLQTNDHAIHADGLLFCMGRMDILKCEQDSKINVPRGPYSKNEDCTQNIEILCCREHFAHLEEAAA